MKKTMIAAILASVAFTGNAFAADAVAEIPPAPAPIVEAAPVFSWSGAYGGIQGGAGWLDGDFSGAGATGSDNFDGGLIGAFAGYNYQMDNNFVFGIEGDVNYNWNENSYAGVDVGTDWAGSVRGRLGYALDNALIYGTAGWAVTNAFANGGGVDESETLNGWTVGAGVDYAFTNNVFARTEYRYTDFSDKKLMGANADFSQHTVTVGLGVKF